MSISDQSEQVAAARAIHEMGCRAVLVKGGHNKGEATDVLYDGKEVHLFQAQRIPTKNTHGTGCTLSSAIAAHLALGATTYEAVRLAKAYVTTAIAHALDIGKGNGPTHHFASLFRDGHYLVPQGEEGSS